VDPRILGQRIAEARKARGKTQEEVADFLECSRPTYIAIEKGDRATRQSMTSSGSRRTIAIWNG
jgi:transcriptional regulator with XRE-family HTH domain